MTSAIARRPLQRSHPHLSTVPSPQHVNLSRSSSNSASLKRTRSIDVSQDTAYTKRQKAAPTQCSPAPPVLSPAQHQATRILREDDKEQRREQRKADREQYREMFRAKYTKAFPGFSFYFNSDVSDEEHVLKEVLIARIEALGGRVEDFFSKDGVTHFITNQLPEDGIVHSNKENHSAPLSRAPSLLKSPIRIRGISGPGDDAPPSIGGSLLHKARSWNMKIWSVAKLESVLDRCNAPVVSTLPKTSAVTGGGNTSLSRLLENERLHGTTERDPTQKRHDFRYFSKNSYFVLVEDLREELATVHAVEYGVRKTRDGQEVGNWPQLYCHPDVRNPFAKPDEREFRRWRREIDQEQERRLEQQHMQVKALERERRRAAEAERLRLAQNAGDLRRSVSMTNMRRRALAAADDTVDDFDLDIDAAESVNASGYLRSHYAAASGNSVTITSTTGTTTSAGNTLRSTTLPASLRGKQQQEIVTSLKVAATKDRGDMLPPHIPHKALRKSKSTTTMRLPKRDEGAKPGYCENCRLKYADFDEHITGRRHRKFATNDANFCHVDLVIDRIRRPIRTGSVSHQNTDAVSLVEPIVQDDRDVPCLRSSSEVSDYLPQPQTDYAALNAGSNHNDEDSDVIEIKMEA